MIVEVLRESGLGVLGLFFSFLFFIFSFYLALDVDTVGWWCSIFEADLETNYKCTS